MCPVRTMVPGVLSVPVQEGTPRPGSTSRPVTPFYDYGTLIPLSPYPGNITSYSLSCLRSCHRGKYTVGLSGQSPFGPEFLHSPKRGLRSRSTGLRFRVEKGEPMRTRLLLLLIRMSCKGLKLDYPLGSEKVT